MGLAASQARFLCITARKADCEYKSTDLAQQKLSITNQLSAISNDYANAMNATKLIWANDTVDGDYGLTYSLLMSPSAVNDYNPYMITTPSGAIVLNSEYAAAARAAGLSKAGGFGSQEQRDKFIQALVPNGLVTQETANEITKYDYKAKVENGAITFSGDDNTNVQDSNGVSWNPFAGLGAEPKNKSVVDAMRLSELIMSKEIGQKPLDWTALVLKDDEISKANYNAKIKEYSQYSQLLAKNIVNDSIINFIKSVKNNYIMKNESKIGTSLTQSSYDSKLAEYEKLIEDAKNVSEGKALNNYRSNDEVIRKLQNIVTSEKNAFNAKYPEAKRMDASSTNGFNLNQSDGKKLDYQGYSIVYNGVLTKDSGTINDMTIGDLLAGSVVLVSNKNNHKDGGAKEDLEVFQKDIIKMLDVIAKVMGYSPSEDLTGVGFNIDEASKEALEFAYNMTKRQFNRVINTGSNTSNSLTDNSAFQNAIKNNTIGTDENNTYLAVSLSNLTSAFLTYYDNFLNMENSDYVVGKSVEQSVYVTDNLNYYYVFQNDGNAEKSIKGKSADFYDELYNNILAHGWREDSAIDDSEYLESMIKDGRYSMSSLNENDGYYYQSRYNDTGYIVEVADTDAIARAEAEFTAKKAELTYKEDSIDLKTKKLDAEISALTTEYDSVKNMISNGIQKVFQQFQS